MGKKVTIKLSDESALWVGRQAAGRNISVSKPLEGLIEEQMRHSDEYWKAFKEWQSLEPVSGADAVNRAGRNDVHER